MTLSDIYIYIYIYIGKYLMIQSIVQPLCDSWASCNVWLWFWKVGNIRTKLNTLVKFPVHGLDMSRHMEKPTSDSHILRSAAPFIYDLYAVCNHYGNLQGGHYTGMSVFNAESFVYLCMLQLSVCAMHPVTLMAFFQVCMVPRGWENWKSQEIWLVMESRGKWKSLEWTRIGLGVFNVC